VVGSAKSAAAQALEPGKWGKLMREAGITIK
jgi:hypothetical protein